MRYVLIAALFLTGIQGFTSPFSSPTKAHRAKCRLAVSEEERAAAMSEYLAKAHEDKLRAVEEVKLAAKKQIAELQQEVDDLKKKGSSAIQTHQGQLQDLSKEELTAKLLSYQQFMAKYIVNAQQQKIEAVKAAEAAVAKKYEEKLMLLESANPSEIVTTQLPRETQLYMERNAKVTAAAKAGKSRWGDLETQRIAGRKVEGPPTIAKAAPVNIGAQLANGTPVANGAVVVPPEVAAADHGLKRDGSMSLAERVALGANAGGEALAAHAAVSRNEVLFHQRNVKVSAAAKAGKSRWGEMENAKAHQVASTPLAAAASQIPSVPVPASVPPEVEAADHGLRADGGVGGPSLAQRVNLGARLLA